MFGRNKKEDLGPSLDQQILTHAINELVKRDGVTDPNAKLALAAKARREMAGGGILVLLPPGMAEDIKAGREADYSRIRVANPIHQAELNQMLDIKPQSRVRSILNSLRDRL